MVLNSIHHCFFDLVVGEVFGYSTKFPSHILDKGSC